MRQTDAHAGAVKSPAFQLYVKDYLADTRHLSLSAKGAWGDCLCFFQLAPVRGEIADSLLGWARRFGCTAEQATAVIDELLHNAPAVADGVVSNGSITLRNRRMHREARSTQLNAARQARFRERHGTNGDPEKSNAPNDGHVARQLATSSSTAIPPPTSSVGAAGDLRGFLGKLGIRGRALLQCCAVPGLTPIGAALVMLEIERDKSVEKPAGMLTYKLRDGYASPQRVSAEILVTVSKRWPIKSVGIHEVEGMQLRYGTRGLIVGADGPMQITIPPAELTPESIELAVKP